MPEGYGVIVGICVHQDKVYVATQYRVCVLEDGKFTALQFVDGTEGMASDCGSAPSDPV